MATINNENKKTFCAENRVNNYEISYLKMKSRLAELEKTYENYFPKIKTEIREPNLSWQTIDELEAKARALDGNYLLKTNRDDLSDDAIWNMYMMLTRVENAFRNLKSNLGLRPNRHHKEKRVDGHINITILAYHFLHALNSSFEINLSIPPGRQLIECSPVILILLLHYPQLMDL